MKHFMQLTDLPIFDLYKEFEYLLEVKKINWYKVKDSTSYYIDDQICLNSTIDEPDSIHLGRGSLLQDWNKSHNDENGNLIVPKRKNILKENDFVVLCNQFKGTLFETVYNELDKKYVLGRVRIMKSKPKTCLTWHVDFSTRVHYPMKTQEGCFMIINNEVCHMPNNTWWWTDTRTPHTALNASQEDRYHLVAAILDKK
jgi:hypothetical protein